jgi:hypothetical protein
MKQTLEDEVCNDDHHTDELQSPDIAPLPTSGIGAIMKISETTVSEPEGCLGSVMVLSCLQLNYSLPLLPLSSILFRRDVPDASNMQNRITNNGDEQVENPKVHDEEHQNKED